jgi:hypothetical protein
MRAINATGLGLLAAAIVLGVCAATGIGMSHAYQNATPRVNPGDSAFALAAASAVTLAIGLLAAPKRLSVPIRIVLSLCLFAAGAWLASVAWLWAFMVG